MAHHPSALPPSVEEAYRRKCIQLKQRTRELEEANDAIRLRVHRIKRQVEKLRLERAFLLEQLAKRTSTNVEDSEGSDSPPPLPVAKPLRIKRGARKASLLPDPDAKIPQSASFATEHTLAAASPGSETFSQANLDDTITQQLSPRINGASRDEYQASYKREAEHGNSTARLDWNTAEREGNRAHVRPDGDAPDDDIEMANYDTDDHDT